MTLAKGYSGGGGGGTRPKGLDEFNRTKDNYKINFI
jgi:hypothetical protein